MGSYYKHDRCSECGSRLTASDEGFDGLCAVCAAAGATRRGLARGSRHSRRRPDESVGSHRLLDVDAMDWVTGILGA